jgi:hypothetical protein
MIQSFQRIRTALAQHCLDSFGNIYTVTLDDVMDYIEKELPPAAKARLSALDEVSLAIEIADAIGNAGVIELIESTICETVKTQIQIAREGIVEALTESGFLEGVSA